MVSTSLFKQVGIASLILMASVFLSRVIGLFREIVIAYVAGAKGAVDVYQIAFVLPEILNHAIATGFLSITFIPIFSRYLTSNREDEGWRVFSVILTSFGSVLIVLIVVSCIFASQLVSLVAPGLKDPVAHSQAVYMTRIILPAQFFFFTGGLMMAVQFAKERFAIPALTPVVYNIGIICGGLLLGCRHGMAGFSWGALVGAFCGSFLLQIYGARKVGMVFSLNFSLHHPDVKKYIRLTLPLMVGLTMTFSTEFFMKFFGSYLEEGRIAALNYSLRVMLMLVGFFGQAIGMASFPFMARLAAEDKIDEMNRLMNTALRYLLLVIPFSVLLIVLRQEVVRILFQRGAFDPEATRVTAQIMVFLMAGAFAFASQTVVVRGYYAVQDTLFPAIFGTISVLLSLPMYYFGMRQMGADGIALAISFSATLQVILLYELWNRRTHNTESRTVYRTFLKMLIFSVAAGLLLEGSRQGLSRIIGTSGFVDCVILTAIIGTIFGCIMLFGGYILKIHEFIEIFQRIGKKFMP